MSTLRSTTADYRNTRAFYAAEGGAESALSQLKLAVSDGRIMDRELDDIEPPDVEGFDFVNFGVTRDGPATVESITDGPWAGMYALTERLTITSEAQDANGNAGAVNLGVRAHSIPIFQFAEFSPEGTQSLAGDSDTRGRFHSNGDMFLYSWGPGNRFHGMVTTAGRIYRDRKRTHVNPDGGNVYIADADGNLVKLTFDSRDPSDPDQFIAKSYADFDGRLQTEAFGVEELKLPLPDGVEFRELVRPLDPANDTEAERETKMAWKADMYVTVDLGDVQDRDAVCSNNPPAGLAPQLPAISVARPNGGAVPDDRTKCEIFYWKWEPFYDSGEEHYVDILNVDIGELGDWIALDPTNNGTEIIYVEFKNPGPVTASGVTDPSGHGYYWPSLKFVDAAQLPGPLTMGSEYPFYTQGDFNTGVWYPASIYGDRLTMLSNQWDDDDPAVDGPVTSRSDAPDATGNTILNVALITGEGEGHVGCYHEYAGCTPDTEDPAWIVKRLEDWKNCSGEPNDKCRCEFEGSFISAWAPQIAKDHDVPPSYKYSDVCNLRREFDTRFLDPTNLPPGTPVVGKVLRAAFREGY